jgi:drug/metabolite transporter superfamily protein YnfA
MSKLDRILKILLSRKKKSKRRYPMAAAGVVAAVLGALIKAATLTKTFPEPFDIYGNIILFIAVLLIVYDIAKGGLYD